MAAYWRVFLACAVLLRLTLALPTCDNVLSILPGKVFVPDTQFYNDSISSYFYLSGQQSPSYIVAPATADEVAIVFKAINDCSIDHVAVRSGGHATNPGFSNADQGVTVDLRGLNDIHLSKEDPDLVSIGAGALSVDVYDVLDPLNRTVLGARVASVGVGGFLTGGGISFFSAQHGFGCDSIRNMQVVLANGTIVEANATSHPRLFRALKGGQNNFGVVTRFDLVAYPQPAFWGGAVMYPSEADAAQLSAFAQLKMSAEYDPHVALEQTFVYLGAQKTYSSTNNMFYTKPVANASALRPFTDIQPQTSNTMRISGASDFATELEGFQLKAQFAVYATLSLPVSATMLVRVHEMWRESNPDLVAKVLDITSTMTYQSIPPPPVADASQNSLGFASNATPQKDMVLLLFSYYWGNDKDSTVVNTAVSELTKSVQEAFGDKDSYKYLNYAASWQDPIASYGKESVRELIQVSKLYDPTGVFQKVVSGGFKLGV
ncbi:FAD binding domain-containing protein [Apiospora saccharicola]|uniref:FAD binding domain-containing protein n=1 Tax=Apiospora saccharicola TaxID=335842 RepID=A0ABR1TNU6_9PEZI